MRINYNDMSNAEISLKLKEMENEYSALQKKMRDELERLVELNEEYIRGMQIYGKRTRGVL